MTFLPMNRTTVRPARAAFGTLVAAFALDLSHPVASFSAAPCEPTASAYSSALVEKRPAASVTRRLDVFVGGTEGYHTFRIPAMVVSRAGTVLAFCEGRKDSARDRGSIDLLVKRSRDGGATWGPIQVVRSEPGRVTIGNPVPVSDEETGAIHLVYCRQEKEVWYVRSTDDGATFTEPVNLTPVVAAMYAKIGFKWGSVHTGPGHGLQTRAGRLVIPLKTAGAAQEGVKRRVGVIWSDDHGDTWLGGGVVASSLGELSESTVIERGDGALLLNMRWHDGAHRAVSLSRDGGKTWTPPRPDPGLPDQVCQGSMLRLSTVPWDRRVLVSNLNDPFKGISKRSGLAVHVSGDDGDTWGPAFAVEPGFSGYSDLAVTRDGRALLLFETGAKIYSEKLTLAWLELGR